MNFNKKKYLNDGYLIQKKIISELDIKNFFKEIKQIIKINKKKILKIFSNNLKKEISYTKKCKI